MSVLKQKENFDFIQFLNLYLNKHNYLSKALGRTVGSKLSGFYERSSAGRISLYNHRLALANTQRGYLGTLQVCEPYRLVLGCNYSHATRVPRENRRFKSYRLLADLTASTVAL